MLSWASRDSTKRSWILLNCSFATRGLIFPSLRAFAVSAICFWDPETKASPADPPVSIASVPAASVVIAYMPATAAVAPPPATVVPPPPPLPPTGPPAAPEPRSFRRAFLTASPIAASAIAFTTLISIAAARDVHGWLIMNSAAVASPWRSFSISGSWFSIAPANFSMTGAAFCSMMSEIWVNALLIRSPFSAIREEKSFSTSSFE